MAAPNYLQSFNVGVPDISSGLNALAGIPGQQRANAQLNLLQQQGERSERQMQFNIERASREDQMKAMEWLGQSALAAGDDPQKQQLLIQQASQQFGIPVDMDDLQAARLHVQGEMQKMQAKARIQAQAGGSVYGTPIYGKDEQGNTVLGAIGKDGTFKKLDTGGVTPTPGVSFQGFGTYRQGFDRAGQPATPQLPIQGAMEPGYVQQGAPLPSGAPQAVAPAPGSKAAMGVEKTEAERRASARGQATVSGFTLRDARIVQETIPKMSDNAIMRLGKAKIPGTEEYKANAYLDSLKGTISIEQLLNIKRQGAGLGQVPQTQLDLLSRLMGELSLGLPKKDLKTLVKDIQDTYTDILRDMTPADRQLVGIADREYRAMGGKDRSRAPNIDDLVNKYRSK